MAYSLVETIRSQFDVRDRKILALLDQNARMPHSQVAKELDISKQGVSYRINKLKEKGVIGRFLTIFNFRRLGYDAYYVQLELQGASKKEIKKILDRIGKQASTVWLLELYGKSDVLFVILARSAAEFNSEFKRIVSPFHKFVIDHSHVVGLDASYGRKNYLPDSPESIYHPNPEIKETNSYKVDSADLAVMKELFENPLSSVLDISRSTKLPHETVAKHIAQLLSENVLLKFTFELNPAVVQYEWHLSYLQFDLTHVELEEPLKKWLGVHPNVTFFTDVVGKWNLLIDLHVSDVEHLYQLIHGMKEKFGQLIRRYETVRVNRVHKCSFLPEKLFVKK